MLSIIFARSSSPKMEMAVIIAQKLGGTYDGGRCVVMIPDSQITKNLKQLIALARIIDQWKLVTVSFRDREVSLFRFLQEVRRIEDCGKDFSDDNHCNLLLTHEGWGCRYLSKPRYHILPGARKSGNYWYNYGFFSGDDEWTINKDLIRHILTTQVRKRGLDLCPFFSFKTLTERINALPDSIQVDGVSFKKVYEVDYNTGETKLKPVNIEHVPLLTQEEEIEILQNEMVKKLEERIKKGGLSEEDVKKKIELLNKIKGTTEQNSENIPLAVPLVDKILLNYSEN